MATQIILTTTGTNSWTVPSDWDSSNNKVEVIGGGGGGNSTFTNGSAGGGGGGYGKKNNMSLTPGASVSYTIGTGGTSAAGGDSYFNGASYAAAPVGGLGGGLGAVAAGGGGAGGAGKGDASFTGGTGGNGQSGGGTTPGAGGGGGAAGPNGNGVNGTAGSGSTGGAGGAGDNGSGGAGGVAPGGAGSNGAEWTTAGAGGGGAGGDPGLRQGGVGGNYGAGAGGTSGNNGNFSGSQGVIVITYTPVTPADRYWVGGTGTWDTSTTTHWSATSGGAGGVSAPIGITANIIFDANSGGGTVTFTTGVMGVNLTFTGYTGTFAGSTAFSLGGNLTLGSGMTVTYTGDITFSATAGKTITTAGKSLLSNIIFNGSGGSWTTQDAFTTTGTWTHTLGTVTLGGALTCGAITLTQGIFATGNNNISASTFSSSNSNARTLTLGSNTITLTSTGTVWNTATVTNFTLTPGTSTIKINDASATGKTFSGGGKTYGNLWLTGAGTGAFTIIGSNTFTDFKCDTPPHTINFTASTTTTLGTFTVNGTAGNIMTLQSTISGTSYALVRSGTNTISCDYLSVKDSHAS